MTEPIFWLLCSFLLVAVCLTAVLMAAIPALRELARASRSAEKLFDTLHRELPLTLDAIRLTGSDISDLTDDLSGGVESAGNVIKQVDQSLRVAQRQVNAAVITTQSVWAGVRAAFKSLKKTSSKRNRRGRIQPLPSTSARRGSATNHAVPRVRPAPPLQRPSHVDFPEPPSSSIGPSNQSQAENHDASFPSEPRFEALPEQSFPSEHA